MPVPQTTGQLRTSIADMEIGDYIRFNYTANKISSGYIDSLNVDSNYPSETLSGYLNNTATKAFAYFVKVDKGLLIADRVIAHSVTWDLLNSNKLIQGLPTLIEDIAPTMTSYTSPSLIVSASSELGIYPSWKVFDKIDNVASSAWISNNEISGAWLQFEFTTPTTISAYSFSSRVGTPQKTPKEWVFEGSNGDTWVELDKQMNVTGWTDLVYKSFTIPPSTYKKFRIRVLSNNGDTINVAIGEMRLYSRTFINRSLTGGVSYLDANGNSSTTDKGLGAFPTNNEWDRYIVNFPTDKIQSGKTLDDVFHWKNIFTFTQDTPSSLIKTNVNRGIRGYYLITTTAFELSNGAYSSQGFRPVFAYKE